MCGDGRAGPVSLFRPNFLIFCLALLCDTFYSHCECLGEKKNFCLLPLPPGGPFLPILRFFKCNFGERVLIHLGLSNSDFCVFGTSENFSRGIFFCSAQFRFLGPREGLKVGGRNG